RERIHAAIVATTLAPHTRALLQALALGDQQGLSDKDWQVLRKTGTSHLVAVSGLHIGLVAASGFWVGWSLWLAFVWLRMSLTRVTMAYF
ncbi:competence protein ComEC, partial [bacterium LRH843]|nr:competence protein ComEC [bacterium LRH843]